MNVKLYTFNKDVRTFPKTQYLSNETIYDCKLIEETSYRNPSIVLYSDFEVIPSPNVVNIIDFKIAKIPDFNRTYFIEDIISINNKMWRLQLRSDVLDTWADAIKSSRAFILRNENSYDNLLVDDCDNFKASNTITIKTFISSDMGDKVNKTFSTGYLEKNIIMTVVNDTKQILGNIDNSSPSSCLPNPHGAVQRKDIQNYMYVFKQTSNLSEMWNETEATYIKSLIVYPFSVEIQETGTPPTPISVYAKLGSTSYTGASSVMFAPSYSNTGYMTIFDYTFNLSNGYDFSKYENYEPYSRYEFFLPFVGYQDVNANDIKDSRIVVSYVTDLSTGKSKCYIVNVTKDYIIKEFDCQIGVRIGISRNNEEELAQQGWSAVGSLAVTGIASVLAMAFGGPAGIIGGVAGIVGGVGSAITKVATLNERAQVGITDGYNGVYNPVEVSLRITRRDKVSTTNNDIVGLPKLQAGLISSYTGFTIADNVRLDGIGDDVDEAEIKELLRKGVIIATSTP